MKKYSTAILCSALALYSHAENTAREGLTSSDRSSLYKAYVAAQHEFRQAANGHHYAQQPRLGWQMSFDGSGFTAKPATKDWQWGLELVDQEGWRFDPNAATSVTGNKLSIHKNTDLVEWFINDQRGLEQGWTVERRPQSYTGPLKLELKIRGDLKAQITPQNISFVDDTGKTQLTYAGLKAWDKDGCILATRFQSSGENFYIEVEDADAAYPITIDPLASSVYVKAPEADAGDKFGASVAISGNTVVIGAPLEDSNAAGINGSQTNNSSTNSGAVYVFVAQPGYWQLEAYLKASNSGASDNFGHSVGISGNTIVVGALLESSAATGVNGNQLDNSASNAGAAYVFERSGSFWTQQAYLKASNAQAGDVFGATVAISGNTIVVTAPGEASGLAGNQTDNSAAGAGAGYVFFRTGAVWKQQAYLKADDVVQGPEAGAAFGFSSAISGNKIVIGAYGDDTGAGADAGAAFVFSRTGTSWGRSYLLQQSAVNGDAGDRFGHSVAISGDTIAVGATWEDSNATGVGGDPTNDAVTDSGAVYIYTHSGVTWLPQAYLKASNTESSDEFGFSVALNGDDLLVGAPQEDSSSLDIDGTEGNGATNSGACYLFTRYGSTWTKQAYLKSANTGAGDNFGWSVALTEGAILSGALSEDSAGPIADDTAADAGAVYRFENRPNLFSLSKSGNSVLGGTDMAYGLPVAAAINPDGLSFTINQLIGTGSSGGRNEVFSGVSPSSPFGGILLLQKGSIAAGILGLPAGAKISALAYPCANELTRGETLVQALVTGPGLGSSNNQVLFQFVREGLRALKRTGNPIPELGGAVPSSFRDIVHNPAGEIGVSYLLKAGAGVTAGSDSGLLILNEAGAVLYEDAREGATAYGGGGNFGQFVGRSSATAGNTFFIAKYTPTGFSTVDALFNVGFFPGRSTPLSGQAAGGILSGERYGMFTGVTQNGFGALLRSTLTLSPVSSNEGVWTDSGSLRLRKGQPLVGGLTLKKIIRVWGTSLNQVFAHVELGGTGVTSSNNQALILRQSDGTILALLRTGQPAPGYGLASVTVGSIQAIDVDHGNGCYVVLGSLKGTAASANQALWSGRTSAGNNTTEQWARLPQIRLRKGDRYTSTLGVFSVVTAEDLIRGISLTPAADASGVGGRGLAQNINVNGEILITLTCDRNIKELVMLRP